MHAIACNYASRSVWKTWDSLEVTHFHINNKIHIFNEMYRMLKMLLTVVLSVRWWLSFSTIIIMPVPVKAPRLPPSHKHAHTHRKCIRNFTILKHFVPISNWRESLKHRCRICGYSGGGKKEWEWERERRSAPQMQCTLSVFQVTKLGVNSTVTGKKISWEKKRKWTQRDGGAKRVHTWICAPRCTCTAADAQNLQ